MRLAAARASPWRWPARCSCTASSRCRAAAGGPGAVGWTQSSAMLVRREAAEEVGYLDPDFFVYSDETDFCKRLHDAGWDVLYVPDARGDPPRPAEHRPAQRAAADRGVPPQPRPLHAQAPQPRPSGSPCARSACGSTSCCAARGRGRAGPRPAPLSAPRAPGADARARRGNPRGGRGVQPPGANRTIGSTPLEHPDLAQLAAVVAAAGAVLLLAGRGRVQVLGGLAPARRRRGPAARSRSRAPASSTR